MSYLVLARKLRPNCFGDLIGQETTAQTLKNAVISNRVAHAFLFTGSRGECKRLQNGNTLINVGRTGNLLEVGSNNDLIWHLSMKNDNSEVASFRSSRIDNLYPLAYSFTINDLQGSYNDESYYYNNTNS